MVKERLQKAKKWAKGKFQRAKRTIDFQRIYQRRWNFPTNRKLNIRDLPSISRRAYRRLGQIFEIDPNKLLPDFEMEEPKGFEGRSYFSQKEGKVHIVPPPNLLVIKGVVEHEVLHSLQFLLNKFEEKDMKELEKVLGEEFEKAQDNKSKLKILLMAIRQVIKMKKRQTTNIEPGAFLSKPHLAGPLLIQYNPYFWTYGITSILINTFLILINTLLEKNLLQKQI